LFFDKGAQKMSWTKDSFLNKWCRENWISICKRLKVEPSLAPCTRINSKRIKGLSVRSETLKQEKIGKILEHIGIGNNFLNRNPIAQQLRERIDKWDFMKLKIFFIAKETVTRLKRQPENVKKSLPAIYLTRN
jgi:hypothetical protein